MPGLLHNKGRDGNLKQCQPGNDSPPLAWVTGLARAPENSYNRLQMASLCCSIGKNIFQFLYISIKNRSRLDSNPRTLDESQTSIPLDYGAMPPCSLFFQGKWILVDTLSNKANVTLPGKWKFEASNIVNADDKTKGFGLANDGTAAGTRGKSLLELWFITFLPV